MARQPKKTAASDDNKNLIVGHPAENTDPTQTSDPSDPGSDPDNNSSHTSDNDELAELKAKLERQEQELAQLKRQTPPANPRPQVPQNSQEDEEPDWEQLLFDNPKEALKLHAERVAKRVTNQLRGEYQQRENTKQFWSKFYEKHDDLKRDHDLVEITLQANLNELANVPVDKAMERLADLTRDRIMRYAGDKGKARKAHAEGASPPSPTPTEPEPTSVTSLSDIIKARARKRRGVAA